MVNRHVLPVGLIVAVVVLTWSGTWARPLARTRTQNGPIDSLEYLANFGYLSKANLETGALRSKEELDTAIKQFQKMAGLRETGDLNHETLAKMTSPRCGMPDKNAPQEFALGPSKWDRTDLTYSIKNYSPDLYWGYARNDLAQAFQIWSDVSPLKFRETSGTADIEITFAAGYHNDGYAFDGPGNVLAHAFPPGSGRGGDAHFDEDEKWTVNSKDGTNLYTVAAHEFGHSLGIYHSNVPGALMYPWYQGYNPNLQLHSDDIRAIQTLYGRSDAPSRPRPPVITTVPPSLTKTPPRIETVRPTLSTAPSPVKPDPCSTAVDAVANVRGEIFAFKGQWFWRLNRLGVAEYPSVIHKFWEGFPPEVDYIDAVYERHEDQRIVFFRGNRFWEFDGRIRAPDCPMAGKPLTDLGLQPGVTHIDAAFVWGFNKRTYLFSGYSYWRMGDGRNFRNVEKGYPKATDMWTGIPVPFDDVLTNFDGKTYFFKGTSFYSFGDKTMKIDEGYPKPVSEMWTFCSASFKAFAPGVTSSLRTTILLTVLAIYHTISG